MYSDRDRWSLRVRQGDVVGEIPFALPTKRAQFVATGAVTGLGLAAQSVIVQAAPRYVAIVSHDCEFNENKRDHFLVAQVERLRKDLTPEQLAELRDGNDAEAASMEGRNYPVDTFFLDPLAGVFEEPRRINFCTITPFAMSSLETMLEFKKAELDHATRVLLRRKLGVFFGRDAEDVPDDERAPAPAQLSSTNGG